MIQPYPQRTHVYQNHHLDSTRWNYFAHRPGDIVISTSYKAGTTWMQSIIDHMRMIWKDGASTFFNKGTLGRR